MNHLIFPIQTPSNVPSNILECRLYVLSNIHFDTKKWIEDQNMLLITI